MRHLLISLAMIPTALGQGTHSTCFKPAAAAQVKHSAQEEKCLATMIYGEARGEPRHGQIAVAYTALNRAAKKTVCAVVLAPKQYSIFNNNAALRQAALSMHIEPVQKNPIDQQAWDTSVQVAKTVLKREVADPTGGATHYIADRLMKIKGYRYPTWSKQYTQVAVISNHRFFKPYYPNRK